MDLAIHTTSHIESFAQLLMDSNPQYIFWKDVEGAYLGCNKLYAQFCALDSTQEIIGTSDYDYMKKEEADICIAADKEVMQNGNSLLNFEEYVTDAHGISRWFNINKIPLKDKEGNVMGVLGTMTDITEAKRNKELIEKQALALEAHVLDLETKNKELENFNYIVAHDLQEPIRNISNFATLLSKSKEYNEEFLGYIVAGSNRMGALLDALLQYYVMGKQDKEKELIDLREIVALAIEQQQAHIDTTTADIIIEDLPSIHGYKVELVSLFQNLISNSIKYRDENKPCQLRIYSMEDTDHSLKIVVEDNGVGMESHQTELAKKIFQRLHTNHSIKGTGIGLAICTKAMHLHSGNLEIKSQPQEGTKVILTFRKDFS